MPLPRMTTRRWMLAVAMTALPAWLVLILRRLLVRPSIDPFDVTEMMQTQQAPQRRRVARRLRHPVPPDPPLPE